MTNEFQNRFRQATGNWPYPYQERLALSDELPSLVAVPTGVGKTAAAVLAWLYRRRFAAESVRAATPRLLIYCLPMRTLVEQTANCVRRWLERLELNGEVGVELLLGGSEVGDWERAPERDCVLIGTQDMLLSRALNRGYGMSRYRWPVDFGLLNNDSLWVIDETQLFGAGLPTTAQLAGLRSKLGAYGANHTLWMSATLDAKQLDTVDHPLSSINRRLELNDDDRGAPEVERLLMAAKPLRKHDLVLNSTTDKQYAAKMVAAVLELHQAESVTLVVVNRVLRARQIGGELGKLLRKKAASAPEVRIVHSRFRPADRKREQAAALDSSTLSAAGRIIVATQAIEAGVDISARTLITELAPWASMVQRFGRCNRRGEFSADTTPAQVVWVDCDETNDKFALPYSARDLTVARTLCEQLTDVGPKSLEMVRADEPLAVRHVLRRKDLLDLWDTTPDLAGTDLDVSLYIRESDDTDVYVYWRDWPGDSWASPPSDDVAFPPPGADELCPVGIGSIRDFLGKSNDERPTAAWRWDSLNASWRRISQYEVFPGLTLLLRSTAGGYLPEAGWTGEAKDQPVPAVVPGEDLKSTSVADVVAMDQEEAGAAVELTTHLQDVADEVAALKSKLGVQLDDQLWQAVALAARWHDVGKAHAAFQTAMLDMFPAGPQRDDGGKKLWAKSTLRGRPRYRVPSASTTDTPTVDSTVQTEVSFVARPGFRHELASALAFLATHPDAPNADLIAFLIAAHHGKVRASIRSLPGEPTPPEPGRRFARGIWDGDELPPVSEFFTAPVRLSLELMELGDSANGEPSWLSRTCDLREQFGPLRLAFLESLVRIADWRASSKEGDAR